MGGGFYKLDANAVATVSTRMIRRTLMLTFLVVTATAAHASWWPVLSNDYVSLETGQETTVTVRAQWSGLVDYGFVPWHFRSSDERVAIVEGSLERPGTTGTLKITAVGPGTAKIYTNTGGGPYGTILVKQDDTPLQIAATPAIVNRPVTLTAINPPYLSTSWWYLGKIGDQSQPLGIGTEVTFTPSTTGITYVWIWSVTPLAASSAELAIDVRAAARTRAVRH